MPRPVDVNIPDKELAEIEMLAKILGRSFSSTLIKMVKLGIRQANQMSIKEINHKPSR